MGANSESYATNATKYISESGVDVQIGWNARDYHVAMSISSGSTRSHAFSSKLISRTRTIVPLLNSSFLAGVYRRSQSNSVTATLQLERSQPTVVVGRLGPVFLTRSVTIFSQYNAIFFYPHKIGNRSAGHALIITQDQVSTYLNVCCEVEV